MYGWLSNTRPTRVTQSHIAGWRGWGLLEPVQRRSLKILKADAER